MKFLLDTNIVIHREDPKIIDKKLANLNRIVNKSSNFSFIIHPVIYDEISKDNQLERKKIILSKLESYPKFVDPPEMKKDAKFLNSNDIDCSNIHDYNDALLLYSLYRNAVDFLITEDKGIIAKAIELDLDNRVFTIENALEFTEKFETQHVIPSSACIQHLPVHNLRLEDRIWDNLKGDYPKFDQWFKKISRKGRKSFVYYQEEDKLGAVCIYKNENEPLNQLNPPKSKKKRIKISTLIVTYTGYKIGELFIKLMCQYALENKTDEIYLTHYIKENDHLVSLIKEFGFKNVGQDDKGESYFIKKIKPITSDRKINKEEALEYAKNYYPSFCDGTTINKYIIPIKPTYQDKLFTDRRIRQTNLNEFQYGGIPIEGNTIRKPYICHSNIRKVKKGDLIFFYRTGGRKALTNIGIIIKSIPDIKTIDEVLKEVGKRTVFSRNELEEMLEKGSVLVLFFYHLYHFPTKVSYEKLIQEGLISGYPQSIRGIGHNVYLKIKERSKITDRFQFSK